MVELKTAQLLLRPLPPRAAALLPQDRPGATDAIGAWLDDEWPLPDILDLMPLHAGRSSGEAPFGIWLMIEAATNAVVGDIGFVFAPNENGEIETGYSVVPSRRRRGYAGEAIAALVAWAFDQPSVAAIVAGTDPDNVASQRVLARAGFAQTEASPTEIRWRLERPNQPHD